MSSEPPSTWPPFRIQDCTHLDVAILGELREHLWRFTGARWPQAIRTAENLTPDQRAYFLSRLDEANRLPQPAYHADESVFPAACIYYLLTQRGTDLVYPERIADPVEAFRSSVADARLARAVIRVFIMLQDMFRKVPECASALERAGAYHPSPPKAPSPADSQAAYLRFFVSAAAAMPVGPDEGQTGEAMSLLTDDELEVMLRLAIEFPDVCPRIIEKLVVECPRVLKKRPNLVSDELYLDRRYLIRHAPPQVRDRLLETDPRLGLWIGDATVRAMPEMSRFDRCTDAYGWERLPNNGRRDLYSETCYALFKRQPGDPPSPVRCVTDGDGACLSCDQTLINLFDFDLTDPCLAFLTLDERGAPADPQPTRLRIPACTDCVHFGDVEREGFRLYARVDLRGGAKVFEHSAATRTHTREVRHPFRPFPCDAWVFRPYPRSPIAAEAGTIYPGSTVGGLPKWWQGDEYPVCPGCQRTMPFIAQVESNANGDYSYYAFLCRRCWITTAFAQGS